jgi:uncharacterized phiE125 gp8 family phage protein
MKLSIVTSATGEPVSVEEVKTHLRVESTDEDDYINSLIISARKIAENKIRRSLLPVTYKLVMDDFASYSASIELPMPPLSTVSSNITVKYVKDTTVLNDTATVASTVYRIDYDCTPQRIYPIYGNEWPSCVISSADRKDAVWVQYVSGYSNRSKVPEPIKLWIKMKVASMYENRQPGFEGKFYSQMQELPFHYFDGLLDPYMVVD